MVEKAIHVRLEVSGSNPDCVCIFYQKNYISKGLVVVARGLEYFFSFLFCCF
jgi:hypothetical protein